ncbi:MAG: aminotransferase class V-fold PLP-dependent enzyme [Acidimicrobiia bacterium]|nr:aminotransferase class V-fold PLP-dependent enzyme [Acidimicrobiia bacterium]
MIYLDNAATSWPKPPAVREAIGRYFGEGGGNPGRSGHRMSVAAARIVEDARASVARLLGASDPGRIVFGKNATEALNLGIHGIVRPGDHVVTSSVEHNSVMRPLRHLETTGVDVTVVACRRDGSLDAATIEAAVRPETRLIVTLHGSNVTGAVLPIGEIAAMARRRGIPYLVDASQTAGSLPIDVEALGVDLLAFTGHKALLGPTGTGGLFIAPAVDLEPVLRGGTGSRSDLEIQPDFLPDAHESGTVNTAGLVGLDAGVRYLLDRTVEDVAAHERSLVARFLDGVAGVDGVDVHGPDDVADRCGVLSVAVRGLVPSEVGTLLDREFDIMCRTGLHCAPGAHRTIGTFPQGSVRFGLSCFTTADEIDCTVEALGEIAAWAREAA